MRSAIDLNYGYKTLTILLAILEDSSSADDSLMQMSEKLDSYIDSWTDNDIRIVSENLTHWNRNSKYALVSQSLLHSLVRVHGVDKLQKIHSFVVLLDALMAYSKRHYDRVQKLHQAVHVLDYITAKMTLVPVLRGDSNANPEITNITTSVTSSSSSVAASSVYRENVFLSPLENARRRKELELGIATTSSDANGMDVEGDAPEGYIGVPLDIPNIFGGEATDDDSNNDN